MQAQRPPPPLTSVWERRHEPDSAVSPSTDTKAALQQWRKRKEPPSPSRDSNDSADSYPSPPMSAEDKPELPRSVPPKTEDESQSHATLVGDRSATFTALPTPMGSISQYEEFQPTPAETASAESLLLIQQPSPLLPTTYRPRMDHLRPHTTGPAQASDNPRMPTEIISEPPISPPLPSFVNPFTSMDQAASTRLPSLTDTADVSLKSESNVKSEGGMPMASTEIPARQGKQAKNHVKSACSHCKTKHLKCDESRPCKRCVGEGRPNECIDLPPKKRGRPANQGKTAIPKMTAASQDSMVWHQNFNYPSRQQTYNQPYGQQYGQQYGYPYMGSAQSHYAPPPSQQLPYSSTYYSQVPITSQALLTTDLTIVRVNGAFHNQVPSALQWLGRRLYDLVRQEEAPLVISLRSSFLSDRTRVGGSARPVQAEDRFVETIADHEIGYLLSSNARTYQETLTFDNPNTGTSTRMVLSFSVGMKDVPFVVMTLVQLYEPQPLSPQTQSYMPSASATPHIATQQTGYRSTSVSQMQALYPPPLYYSSKGQSLVVAEPLSRNKSVRPTYNSLDYAPLSATHSPPVQRSTSYRTERPAKLDMSASPGYQSADTLSYGTAQQGYYNPLLPSPERLAQSGHSEIMLPPIRANVPYSAGTGLTITGNSSGGLMSAGGMSAGSLTGSSQGGQAQLAAPMRTAEYGGGLGGSSGTTRKRSERELERSESESEDDEGRPRKRVRTQVGAQGGVMGIRDITG